MTTYFPTRRRRRRELAGEEAPWGSGSGLFGWRGRAEYVQLEKPGHRGGDLGICVVGRQVVPPASERRPQEGKAFFFHRTTLSIARPRQPPTPRASPLPSSRATPHAHRSDIPGCHRTPVVLAPRGLLVTATGRVTNPTVGRLSTKSPSLTSRGAAKRRGGHKFSGHTRGPWLNGSIGRGGLVPGGSRDAAAAANFRLVSLAAAVALLTQRWRWVRAPCGSTRPGPELFLVIWSFWLVLGPCCDIRHAGVAASAAISINTNRRVHVPALVPREGIHTQYKPNRSL